MVRKNFKQLFSIALAALFGIFGLLIGFALLGQIQQPEPPGVLNLFKEATKDRPYYLSAIVTAVGMIGLLAGGVIAPKLAQRLIDAGNAVENMSAKDKIAVGIGTILGLILALCFLLPSLLISTTPLARVISVLISVVLAVAFVYLGIRGIMSMKDELRFVGTERHAGTRRSQPHRELQDSGYQRHY